MIEIQARYLSGTVETVLKIAILQLTMATYTFTGKIEMGKETQKFEREVEAESEKHAKEKVLSELGSEHSTSRGNITLE